MFKFLTKKPEKIEDTSDLEVSVVIPPKAIVSKTKKQLFDAAVRSTLSRDLAKEVELKLKDMVYGMEVVEQTDNASIAMESGWDSERIRLKYPLAVFEELPILSRGGEGHRHRALIRLSLSDVISYIANQVADEMLEEVADVNS